MLRYSGRTIACVHESDIAKPRGETGAGHRGQRSLFAMANLAAADAVIGCWNDKYYWQFWRPITAIRAADADGNPATQADPTWLPLFDPVTPVCTRHRS